MDLKEEMIKGRKEGGTLFSDEMKSRHECLLSPGDGDGEGQDR